MSVDANLRSFTCSRRRCQSRLVVPSPSRPRPPSPHSSRSALGVMETLVTIAMDDLQSLRVL